jgi:FG-GAP-like repeat
MNLLRLATLLALTVVAASCNVADVALGITTPPVTTPPPPSSQNYFGAPLTTPVAGGPWALATADFNRDGRLDLIVTTCQSADSDPTDVESGACDHDNVTVLFGQGDGTLKIQQVFTADRQPTSITVGDFDGDGWADVAVGGTTTVSLFSNDHGVLTRFATLTPQSQNEVPVQISDLGTADLDHNGTLDIVVVDADSAVSVFMNQGAGVFASPMYYAVREGPSNLKIADVDGDGRLDLLISQNGPLLVFPGVGDGTFGAAKTQGSMRTTSSLAAADFNGDGSVDVAVLDPLSGQTSIGVLTNNSTAGLSAPTSYAVQDNGEPTNVVAADFDGDGLADFAYSYWYYDGVVGNGTYYRRFAFRLSKSGATTTQAGPDLPSPEVFFLTAGDFNGDGRPDLAYTDATNELVGVLLNTWGGSPIQ